jgi:hypothetical protein
MITQNELALWPLKVATGANIAGLLHGIRLFERSGCSATFIHSLNKEAPLLLRTTIGLGKADRQRHQHGSLPTPGA